VARDGRHPADHVAAASFTNVATSFASLRAPARTSSRTTHPERPHRRDHADRRCRDGHSDRRPRHRRWRHRHRERRLGGHHRPPVEREHLGGTLPAIRMAKVVFNFNYCQITRDPISAANDAAKVEDVRRAADPVPEEAEAPRASEGARADAVLGEARPEDRLRCRRHRGLPAVHLRRAGVVHHGEHHEPQRRHAVHDEPRAALRPIFRYGSGGGSRSALRSRSPRSRTSRCRSSPPRRACRCTA
jgi:hypothetical protein